MSPAYTHEQFAERLSILVLESVIAFDLPCKTSRSTTFRRRKRQAGAEADASFYLASAAQIYGRRELSLRRDPPPDLVIEVVNTHPADEAVEVWRRFGVPEVWVADASRVRILTLQADGAYAEASHSPSFPALAATEIFDWMMRDLGALDSDWIKALRAGCATFSPLGARRRCVMATVAVSPNEPEIAFADQCVVMHNIGWDGYSRRFEGARRNSATEARVS